MTTVQFLAILAALLLIGSNRDSDAGTTAFLASLCVFVAAVVVAVKDSV